MGSTLLSTFHQRVARLPYGRTLISCCHKKWSRTTVPGHSQLLNLITIGKFNWGRSLSSSSSSRHAGFYLYDSLSDSCKQVPTDPSMKKALAWYQCGPTTYAPAHLGHARTYVCLDIVRRVLEHQLISSNRPPPLFVMNITDVDDKILATSQETGESALALARRFEQDFWSDLDALNCLRPHVVTRVSEHVVSDVVPYIQKICERGMAYETDDGVYFDLRSFDEKLGKITKYGKLAPPSIASDFFSRNTDTSDSPLTTKKDSRDFVLWKKRKENEDLFWDSPWGEGRPGWHIECSAMIEAVSKAFKDTHEFQFHAGGVDLKFPHHTNEIAQSEAYCSDLLEQQRREWIPHWIHTGHLHIDGMKMSKSLKNFITIDELLNDGKSSSALTSPADDFRLWCLGLAGSYRSQATFSLERIDEARMIREKLVKFLIDGTEWVHKSRLSGSKKWTPRENDLYTKVNQCFTKSYAAIMNDLDGKSFLQELIAVTDIGNAYLRSPPSGPTEPIEHCLSSLRRSLALVGFSDKTVRVGMELQSPLFSQGVAGGERALIEELVTFRTSVRDVALASTDGGSSVESISEILRLCDVARDQALPSIGVQVMDGDPEKSWRYCLPSSRKSSTKDVAVPSVKETPIGDIPLEDFFKVGQYEGMFSDFNEIGIPTTHSDGSAISSRKMKKLMAKRQKHEERLIARGASKLPT